jgi:hypothetical protein
MPGIMIEELTILGETELEIPSLCGSWPARPFKEATSNIILPEILVIG